MYDIAVCVYPLTPVSISTHTGYIIIIVGVITRAVSVTTDAVVLGITLWKTFYIFRIDREARSTTKLTTALAYNGTTQLLCNVLLLMKHFTR